MADPPFLRVVWQGVALAFGLLLAVFLLLLGGLEWALPGQVSFPVIGTVGGIGWAAGIGAALLMLVASVFLMVPVASAFSALFLDGVAEVVEAQYPGAQGRSLGFAAGLAEGLGLLALMLVANGLALLMSFVIGPFAPVLFWAVNGWLLGREYFLMAALRHMDRDAARALMARQGGTIWLAGTLMAVPLSLPLVSLFVPVVGAATFTHLFLRLQGR